MITYIIAVVGYILLLLAATAAASRYSRRCKAVNEKRLIQEIDDYERQNS